MPGGSGEVTYFAVAFLAFLLWCPAFAATAFAWPCTDAFLRRRGAANWLSRGVATAIALSILVAWLPIYLFGLFFFFELVGWSSGSN